MSTETDSVQGPDGRLFRSLIRRVAADSANRDSLLADSHHECPYSEIPGHIEELQSFLATSGVSQEDCLTLELNNSVRAALGVLALLDGGFSFMTMPVAGQGARAGTDDIRYAKFSRWIVSVKTDKPTGPLTQTPASSYLSVRLNEAFDPAAVQPKVGAPRLFFRTSGSTGAAKLAVYSHRAFYLNSLNALEVRGFNPTHRITLPTPIFHVYGLGAGFLAGLAGGSSIDLQERSNILRFFEREAEFQPNIAYVTPSFCEMLIRGRRRARLYEFMIVSGDRISESTFRRCEELHGPMINQYGATELGVVAASRLDMPLDLRCRTVGRLVKGVESRIVALAADQTGEAGELQIKHAFGFEGYVDLDGRELIPPKAFDGQWYRTGDLATAGPDGTLAVLGRCDLSVNRQGVLLPLAEVESRMRELEGVEEVVVTAGPQNMRGRSLVAFCVLAPGFDITGPDLRASYAKNAPSFSVPEEVCIMGVLPKLDSGKVDRQRLTKLANEVCSA